MKDAVRFLADEEIRRKVRTTFLTWYILRQPAGIYLLKRYQEVKGKECQ